MFRNNIDKIEDGTAEEIIGKLEECKAIANGRTEAGTNKLVQFIYYSGHGVVKNGRTYLVTNEPGEDGLIDIDKHIKSIGIKGNVCVIAVLDCCRDFEVKGKGIAQLYQMLKPEKIAFKSRHIVYAVDRGGMAFGTLGD